MTEMVVGYKLIDAQGATIQSWGGTWGQCPGIPNPLKLPNGDLVHAPSLNTDYNGYTLVDWSIAEPLPSVPESITPRQCRLLLLQQGLLASVEATIAQSTEDVRISWEYASEFQRDDPILLTFATALGFSDTAIDQFFIAAAQL